MPKTSNAPPARRGDALPAGYTRFLAEVKARIAAARTRAVLAVNSELIKLYWDIGHEILERQRDKGWGTKVIDRLAADLRREFPEMTGLSRSNLHYMRSFAEAWPPTEDGDQIVPQAVGQLPWGHIRCLLDKLDTSPPSPTSSRASSRPPAAAAPATTNKEADRRLWEPTVKPDCETAVRARRRQMRRADEPVWRCTAGETHCHSERRCWPL